MRFGKGTDLEKGRLGSARDRRTKVTSELVRYNVRTGQGMTMVAQSQQRNMSYQGEKEQIAGQKTSPVKRDTAEYDYALWQYRTENC